MVVPDLERAVIEVFGGCNYTCQMCPQTFGRGKGWTRKLPLKTFEKILDQLPGKPVINLEGSGEPTLAKDLDKYILAAKNRGFPVFMYCNGSRLSGDFMKRVVDAGIDFIRFSIIGYNHEMYKKWMNIDNWDLVLNNAKELQRYIKSSGSSCQFSSYHLILEPENAVDEIKLYQENFIKPTNSIGYIWKMHNWSGNYNPEYQRSGKRKTCGRPFAPEITVRAGGVGGRHAAVTPCCQTLGPPNEEKSVLGYLDGEETLKDVYFGQKYEELRLAHKEGRFDDIDYCKNCDFLYKDPEVLVWTNDPDQKVGKMLGTNLNLSDYDS